MSLLSSQQRMLVHWIQVVFDAHHPAHVLLANMLCMNDHAA